MSNESSTALTKRDDSTAIANTNFAPSVGALLERKRMLDHVMKEVLVDGVHYGKIPGCGDKPTLFKAGAEAIATAFRLAPKFTVDRIDLPNGHREYQITCHMYAADGSHLGDGVGTSTTMESRHRWRKATPKCPECGTASLFKTKPGDDEQGFYCWKKKDGCGARFSADDRRCTSQASGRIENPDIADVYNNVLKVAKKRAQVDATLTVCSASDVLAQDLEDLAPDDRQGYDRNDDVRDAEYTERRTAPASSPSKSDVEVQRIAQDLLADVEDMRTEDDRHRIARRAKQELGGHPRALKSVMDAFNRKIQRDRDTDQPSQ